MEKTAGYRGMLRDRCPKVINYALKWQKAKEKWIEHAYCYFVKILGDEINEKGNVHSPASHVKRHVINILLGLKKGKPVDFDFDKSIDWDNLDDEEKVYWKRISSWVKWFQAQYAYMENAYKLSKQAGKSEFDIKVELINGYLSALLPSEDMEEEVKRAKYKYVDDLVDFLIKCFEERI